MASLICECNNGSNSSNILLSFTCDIQIMAGNDKSNEPGTRLKKQLIGQSKIRRYQSDDPKEDAAYDYRFVSQYPPCDHDGERHHDHEQGMLQFKINLMQHIV